MKSKLSWIFFIPLTLAACFCKLAYCFLSEGSVYGLSARKLEYVSWAAVVLIFVFCAVFCLIDRRIGKYYLGRTNVPAGIFGLGLAVALAIDGANAMMHMFSAGKYDVLGLLDAVFAVLAAILFIVLGLNHLSRNRESKRFSVLYVTPAVLCAVRMITSFVAYTTISIRTADVGNLICYVFATLFFYHYAISLSLIKAKNAVRNCFMYGFPAAAALLSCGAGKMIPFFDTNSILSNLHPFEMLLMGLYILSFLIELTIYVRRDDQITVFTSDMFAVDHSAERAEEMLVSAAGEDDKDLADLTSYLDESDAEGYLYQETHQEEEKPKPDAEPANDVEGYLTQVTELAPEEDDRPKSYESHLDDIDKLILEINENMD